MTLLTEGPRLSTAAIRSWYFSTSDRAVNLPDFIPACSSTTVISSSSNGFTPEAEAPVCAGSGAAADTSRAAPRAGQSGVMAAAVPPRTAVLRNERREEFEDCLRFIRH